MHLFAYNGKSSQEFMVNISGGDTWRKPAPIMETITVPGRNGQILNFTGSYENVDVPYHCGIGGDFDARYTAFINWLLSSPGYHQLEGSYHPDIGDNCLLTIRPNVCRHRQEQAAGLFYVPRLIRRLCASL